MELRKKPLHGNQAGGSLHTEATSDSAGFLSSSDKIYLDELTDGSYNNLHSHRMLFTNSTELISDAGSEEHFEHNLGNRFVSICTYMRPVSGSYIGEWINGGSTLTVVLDDDDSFIVLNEGSTTLPVSSVVIAVVG